MVVSGLTSSNDFANLRPQFTPESSSSSARSAHDSMRDGTLTDAVERFFSTWDADRKRDVRSSAGTASDSQSKSGTRQIPDGDVGVPSGLLPNLLGNQVVSGLSSDGSSTSEDSARQSGFPGSASNVSASRPPSQQDDLPNRGTGSASTLGSDLANGFAIGASFVPSTTDHAPNAAATNPHFGGGITLAPRIAHSEVSNEPPIANDDMFDVTVGNFYPDSPIPISVLANDYDPNGDPLTVISVSAPTIGTAWIDSMNVVWFQPPADQIPDNYAPFELAYQITDGRGEFAQAKIKQGVGGRPDGPGIMVTDRHVLAFGIDKSRHTAVLIVPTNQEGWSADPQFASTFTVNGTDYHYATISAGPVGPLLGGGTLQSRVNWDEDAPRQAGVVAMLQVPGGIPEDQFITRLFALDANYQDNLPYHLKLEASPPVDYNSNSYVHGLLNAAFVLPPNLSQQTKHPGWETPVPIEEFD
jgi:hypothetical protein